MGVLDQLGSNKLGSTYSTKFSEKELIEVLNKTCASTISKNNFMLYTGAEGAELFWEVAYGVNSIKLYGVKFICHDDSKGYIYEAVIFDELPKGKAYSICFKDMEEETDIDFISPTCIRFALSKPYSEKYNFKLVWDNAY